MNKSGLIVLSSNGFPSASIGNTAASKYSMPAFLWRTTQFMRFSLNKEEKQMHQSAVFFMLNNAKNGEIVSWYSKKRFAGGKVRVIHSFPIASGHCRVYQAYIKVNGVARHMTNKACKQQSAITWQFLY